MNEASSRSLLKTDVSSTPLLLVSVRDAWEADQALAGGADIIDIKEPHHGALGMANFGAIQAIAAMKLGETPLSVAAGEAGDWLSSETAVPGSTDSNQAPGFEREATPFSYCKLGLAGFAESVDWQARWQESRERASRILPARQWVAVAYADHHLANSPQPALIVDEAIRSGLAGFLIDTYGKTNGGLLEFVSPTALGELIDRLHANGLFVALAGQVDRALLPRLLPLNADVIAIRTAACRNGDRNGRVEADAIREFKRSMWLRLGC
ncbi:MAG: hypothetical protein O3A00_06460 [Planctomycetota bacterium]|nr:hypothetical protein [Planctomycetota bacterium]